MKVTFNISKDNIVFDFDGTLCEYSSMSKEFMKQYRELKKDCDNAIQYLDKHPKLIEKLKDIFHK